MLDSTCTTLTKPNPFGTGTAVRTFTAPGTGIDLNASTTYHVVVDVSGGSNFWDHLRTTTSDSEDTGGATGWSIANVSKFRARGSTSGNWSNDSNSGSGMIAIVGYAKANTPALSAGSITATTATLTLANNSAAWYYKKTSPTPAGTCTSRTSSQTTVSLTSLTAGTSYTHKAYSDSSCTTEIGSATFTTKIAGPTGTSTGVDVSYDKTYGNTASGWPLVNLTYDASKPLISGTGTTGTCATGTTFESGWYRTNALTTLVGTKDFLSRATVSAPVTPGDYQLLAYCTKGAGMSKVYSAPVNLMGTNGKVSIRRAVAVSLSAVTLSPTVARLEIGNYTGEWWHKFTLPSSGATCTSASVFPTD